MHVYVFFKYQPDELQTHHRENPVVVLSLYCI